MYVYLLRTNEFYKIGITKNLSKRVKQLQTGNSEKIELICSYESDYAKKIEKTLHNKYASVKKTGEWFTLSVINELEFINECKAIEDNVKFLIINGNKFI